MAVVPDFHDTQSAGGFGCDRNSAHGDIGIVAYVEGTGIGPYEGAKVQVMGSGRVSVVTGVGTQGQGHYTSYAQIVAEHAFEVSHEHPPIGQRRLKRHRRFRRVGEFHLPI